MYSPLISPSDRGSEDTTSAAMANKARFWNRVARKYASDPIADLGGYERTLQRVKETLSTEYEVLEIGCGTGSTALRLAPATRRLVATDISKQMIAIAREKLASHPAPQLDFNLADADGSLSEDNAYDVVLAFNMLHLVSSLSQTLKSVVKALKPGGLLISKTPCLNEMNPLIPKIALPLMRVLGKAPPVLCFTAAQLQDAMKKADLEIISAERHGSKGKDFRIFIIARNINY
ncbi:class I SAM-dependent methyltransferase [Pseudomonas sp. 32.2.56]|uniref:class I SAM-dependent methyltransferase n=1 Tax=Pseudomonas TaxID=286 RepID=UPI001F394D92|nr:MULTISPECIES: class I SAM-dependent methyltransferase [Pseudomonas]MCE5365271.1 class I SAM-dependent methyltransferase [Pseudomonas anguilliseptica]MCR4510497.1 class I SAM-dependent methyltransferase [Pseudomonas sp. 32.2.56]